MSVLKPQNLTSLYEKWGLRVQFMPSPWLGLMDCAKISRNAITKHFYWQGCYVSGMESKRKGRKKSFGETPAGTVG